MKLLSLLLTPSALRLQALKQPVVDLKLRYYDYTASIFIYEISLHLQFSNPDILTQFFTPFKDNEKSFYYVYFLYLSSSYTIVESYLEGYYMQIYICIYI